MKKFIVASFLLMLFCGSVFGQSSQNDQALFPKADFSQRAQLIAALVAVNHYNRVQLNDSISELMLENYLTSLDPAKLYFRKSDIEDFSAFKKDLDDHLKNGKLDLPFLIFRMYKLRYEERFLKIEEELTRGFDFSLDESFQPDRSDFTWEDSMGSLDDYWRKYLKSQVLNVKINGRTEAEAIALIKDRYTNYYEALNEYDSEDVFQVFMNSFSEACDPHTNYLSPESTDNFRIRMHKSLEGIGATLRTVDNYTEIVSLNAGGPAIKSKQLKVGDRIVAVGQGEVGEMEDVMGLRVTEVVEKIRGDKGTMVRLNIIPAGKPLSSLPIEVRLIREKIKLEEELAESQILPFEKDGKTVKIGVIKIPSFYLDFEGLRSGDPDYRSTSKDVKKFLMEFKNADVDGVILDLRNNGGGALLEAIELAGLFIPEGPVVQVKNSNGQIEVGTDPDPQMVYDGAMAVLVNRFSASASEIFAGAIQDYERGVILGEQTFGKGTVQNVVELSRYLPESSENQGQLNLTLSKYYRITGSSTQHLGVTPDIAFPSALEEGEYGESSNQNALPWDEIKPTDFKKMSFISNQLLNKLHANYLDRLQENKEMQDLIKEIEYVKGVQNENRVISLKEEKFKEQQEQLNRNRNLQMELDGEGTLETEIGSDADLTKLKDPYLKSGLEILSDLIVYKMG